MFCRERTKQKKWRKKSYFIAKKKPKNHRNIKKSLAFLKRVCMGKGISLSHDELAILKGILEDMEL